ncbi:MAG: DUF1294 domain-containing protein [Oscillospiraceae bacterium]|nr:DUF1294 domain-containing protein [Oscillospiraceae bacterium]
MDTFSVLLIYFEAVNLLALAMMGMDKHRAKTNRERIPEAALMTMAVIGGSIGALGGMYLLRHKTRKKKFTVGIPVILGMQVVFALLLFFAVGFGG